MHSSYVFIFALLFFTQPVLNVAAEDADTKPSNSFQQEASIEILDGVALFQEDLGQFKLAEKTLREVLRLRKLHNGEKHWKTIDAQIYLEDLQRRMKMSDTDRKRLKQARALSDKAAQQRDDSDYRGGLKSESQALAVYTELLGSKHPEVATSLTHIAMIYCDMESYTKAMPFFLRATVIRKSMLGDTHPDTAVSLNNLGWNYLNVDDLANAEIHLTAALQMQERIYPNGHNQMTWTLSNLGPLYRWTGKLEKAEKVYLRWIRVCEKVHGSKHQDTLGAMDELGWFYEKIGKVTEAEAVLNRVLAIKKKSLEADDPAIAKSLQNLALFHDRSGDYEKAELLYFEVIKARERIFGTDHLKTASTLNILAEMYDDDEVGEYAKAEPLYSRVLKIKEKRLGPDHVDVAVSLDRLALVYGAMGNLAKAEALHLRALGIREKSLGPKHHITASTMNNLGLLYMEMGEFAKGERLLKTSLKYTESELGPNHAETATSLINVASAVGGAGKYEEAQKLYARAMEIRERIYGQGHPKLATILESLSSIHEILGEHEKALAFAQDSVKIREKYMGADHPWTASSLGNLARAFAGLHQFEKSKAIYDRILAIRENAFGSDHPGIASTLTALADISVKLGDENQAWRFAKRASDIHARSLDRVGATASQRSSFLASQGADNLGKMLVCLSIRTGRLGKEIDGLATLERGRSVSLRQMLAQAKAQSTAKVAPEVRKRIRTTLTKIGRLNNRIAERTNAGKDTTELREQLSRLELEHDKIVRELDEAFEQVVAVETAKGLSSEQAVKSTALDDHTAVVGWITSSYGVYAYVIRRTGMYWVDLSKHCNVQKVNDWLNEVDAITRLTMPKMTPESMAGIYRHTFQPIEKHLSGIKRLIVIAQGWTGTRSLSMLLTGTPKSEDLSEWPWLNKRYTISYSPSMTTLDILVRQAKVRSKQRWPNTLFALGDPPFSSEQLRAMKAEESEEGTSSQVVPAFVADTNISRALQWDAKAAPPRIPGTRVEIQGISAAIGSGKTSTVLGPDANERKLMTISDSGELKQFRYVHFATHGEANSRRPELSGLILARAPKDVDYDGVLHMREVFNLNLDADLVTLSACQTGLGKNQGGEGVVGLSQAFFFAGTSTVVMSLWNVNDLATALLMQKFYTNLTAGKSKVEALQLAQTWLRELNRGELDRLLANTPSIGKLTRGIGGKRVVGSTARSQKPFAHPHYWAGFVLTGDPG